MLTRDNSVQQKHLKELLKLNGDFFQYLDGIISDKMNGKIFLADDLEGGRRMMADIRQVLKRMENEEQALLKERISTSERYGLYSSILIVIAAIIALLISGVFFVRILRDYTQRLKLQLDLEKSEKDTAERILVISGIAGQISEGNYNIRVEDSESDALGSVAYSLNNMAQALDTSFQILSDKEWLQTGIAELNKVMIGEKSLEQLTKDVVEFIAIYTNSNAAALYLLEGDELVYSSGFSYVPSKERVYFKIGDGLMGQAVVSEKIMKLKS